MYSTLFLVVMVGAAVLVGLRVFPIYLNEFKVRNAVTAVAQSPEASEPAATVVALRRMLQSRWDIDDIKNLKVGEIKFVKTPDGRVMRYDYEVRTALFANWSLVLQFANETVYGDGS